MIKLFLLIASLFCLVACSHNPHNVTVSTSRPDIFPDYADACIPINIAPLNFAVRNADYICVDLSVRNKCDRFLGKKSIDFPLKKWHQILSEAVDDTINVVVTVCKNNVWVQYEPFNWYVSADSIDMYLSYRLIEPGYEVWNKLQIVERDLSSFDERVLADNSLYDYSCMNCHMYGRNSGVSLFHLRGQKGGTMLCKDGRVQKLLLKDGDMNSAAVYGSIHQSGRYGAFSTNVIVPELHSNGVNRLEVFDSSSDLVVADFDSETILTQPFLSDTLSLETFPEFSAKGDKIYYCAAKAKPLPDSLRSLQYSICSVGFDAANATIGTQVDTLWSEVNGSASFPKCSPDGRWLLFTEANYGTFPIWHRESDLRLIDLRNGCVNELSMANDTCSDSYHSWSSNSRWFAFASKRADGVYGRIYVCHITADGSVSRPFVVPLKSPFLYDETLKSYNIPELSAFSSEFNSLQLEDAYNRLEAIGFKLRTH